MNKYICPYLHLFVYPHFVTVELHFVYRKFLSVFFHQNCLSLLNIVDSDIEVYSVVIGYP